MKNRVQDRTLSIPVVVGWEVNGAEGGGIGERWGFGVFYLLADVM